MNLPEEVSTIVRDPVTLEPVDASSTLSESRGYLALRAGGLSRKNEQEVEHFRRTFQPLPPEEKLYGRKISSLPKPETTAETIVLDIGCGPYDCISAMPGIHVFLDDIMNLYVDELNAPLGGTPICARTELMPFESDSIDLMYSVNMLDHVDDMPATLTEMHRILAPGGRIYCQSYFNSHPLLETEPGVFDRVFYDDYVLPLFEVEHVQTYACGDPKISRSYTMDVIGMVLAKREGVDTVTQPRDRYLDPQYFGPQSHISIAIGLLDEGDAAMAERHIKMLEDEPFYDLQLKLLRARLAIVQEDLSTANAILKDLRSNARVTKNPHARLAVNRLQNQRITAANRKLRETNARLRKASKKAAGEVNRGPDPLHQRARHRLGSLAKRFARS